jgi:Dolichyl-phosphate-mannose-protein mannosyltransferase
MARASCRQAMGLAALGRASARHPGFVRGQAPNAAAAAALAALLVGAALLRLDGIRYGLPFGLLNPDEESIVPRAWRMTHGGGLNPGWFDYPTLVMYLLAPFQAWQDEPSYLAGRIPIAALGVVGVAAAWWLGRRAYGPAAGWVAAAATAVATVHVAYSRMAVTDIPLTLGVTAALALALAGRLEWAGIAAGLAASAKYPGVLLAVPLLVAGWGHWRRLALAAGLGVVAFAVTSPFVLVHPLEAADDALDVRRLAHEGWLGFEHDGPTPIAFGDRLWEALGPSLVLAGIGLTVALVRRRRADLVLAAFVLVYFADLLTLNAHFDRYVLPLIPTLGALAGRVRALAPLALVLLVVPLAWSLADNAELRDPDTRVAARDWIERNVPAGASVAVESSTAPLERFDVTPLALPGPGRALDPRRDVGRLHADGIEYVLVTGAVADRVIAARERYPRAAGFYDALRARADRLFYLEPGADRSGPWVALYRLRSAS